MEETQVTQEVEAQPNTSSELSEKEYENAMIEAFIDKPEKTLWYQNAFSKFNVNGIDTMKWVWSWWAFFGGWAFLLYRKQYIPALVLFFVALFAGIIPFGGLIVAILAGGFSTYFVYKGYKHKKAEIEASIDDIQKRIETMRAVGGYNQWVIWVYAIFVALLFFYIFSIIATMGSMN
ncbi:hypothetical protein [Sulfurimonas paralvinellae]|uniref:DUF2628 domain-containing protein n=1 Tax=Sulfurimonas paralvinellae TaxID=317658 RepID=A0A7M1B5B9_9BACT|nr:hypothetical protein [Sulfurimonas paralvinellae]QOP44919.1 hypothetical protein FM071_00850 [Sulfurimonas paralvinellae]